MEGVSDSLNEGESRTLMDGDSDLVKVGLHEVLEESLDNRDFEPDAEELRDEDEDMDSVVVGLSVKVSVGVGVSEKEVDSE